jgi:hypothetical protein
MLGFYTLKLVVSIVTAVLLHAPTAHGEQTPAGQKNEQTPWPLVRKRTIPTDRPLLFGEI